MGSSGTPSGRTPSCALPRGCRPSGWRYLDLPLGRRLGRVRRVPGSQLGAPPAASGVGILVAALVRARGDRVEPASAPMSPAPSAHVACVIALPVSLHKKTRERASSISDRLPKIRGHKRHYAEGMSELIVNTVPIGIGIRMLVFVALVLSSCTSSTGSPSTPQPSATTPTPVGTPSVSA